MINRIKTIPKSNAPLMRQIHQYFVIILLFLPKWGRRNWKANWIWPTHQEWENGIKTTIISIAPLERSKSYLEYSTLNNTRHPINKPPTQPIHPSFVVIYLFLPKRDQRNWKAIWIGQHIKNGTGTGRRGESGEDRQFTRTTKMIQTTPTRQGAQIGEAKNRKNQPIRLGNQKAPYQ